MVDCRSLVEFPKSLIPQRNMANSVTLTDQLCNSRQTHPNYKNKKQPSSSNLLMNPPCDQSPSAAIDIVILILVLGACGFLVFPYVSFICHGIAEIGSVTLSVIKEEMGQCPLICASLAVSFFLSTVAVWGICYCRPRKCDNPNCRGLRKAAEFDVQLETEECLKNLPSLIRNDVGKGLFELGEIHHKELEAELRKMAPPNGRAVLIFRARCGCSVGRIEVLGPKKRNKIKK